MIAVLHVLHWDVVQKNVLLLVDHIDLDMGLKNRLELAQVVGIGRLFQLFFNEGLLDDNGPRGRAIVRKQKLHGARVFEADLLQALELVQPSGHMVVIELHGRIYELFRDVGVKHSYFLDRPVPRVRIKLVLALPHLLLLIKHPDALVLEIGGDAVGVFQDGLVSLQV